MGHLVTYSRGIHICGSPVWLDAERRRELCVLTAFGRRLPPLHQRAVASTPLAEALGRAGHAGAVLGTPWGRWLGLGGLRLQLLDAQSAMGGGAALVELPHERLLITGALRAQPAGWPVVDHVVTQLPAFLHDGAQLEALAPQLALQCERLLARGLRPHIAVDHLESGMALAAALAGLGVTLQLRGVLARLLPSARAAAAASLARRPSLGLRDGREPPGTLYVDACGGGAAERPPGAVALRVRYFAAAAALQAMLACCRARQLTLVDAAAPLVAAVRAAVPRHIILHSTMQEQPLPLRPRASAAPI